MAGQLAVHELLEAAHGEWLACKAALRGRRTEILDKTRRRLEAGEDPDRDVLPGLFRDLLEEGIVDASLAFVVTRPGEAMMLGFVDGVPADVIRRYLQLDFGEGICGIVAKTRRMLHVTDIQCSREPMADLLRSCGVSAYVCEPLLADERILGTLSFATRARRRFDPEDLHLFRSVAGHVASARDRLARAFELRRSMSAALALA